MRYIDRIDRTHLYRIEPDLRGPLHEISYRVAWEPRVDEDTYSLSLIIRYIDEELCMSERGDDHASFLQRNDWKAKEKVAYQDNN